MNKFSNRLTDCRSRLLDAEANLNFMRNRENLNTLLEHDSPDVVVGAMIDHAWNLVAEASGDCEAMTEICNEDLGVELHHTAKEILEAGHASGEKAAKPDSLPAAAGLTAHSKHMDMLDEIHEQSLAMLNMLMLNHRHASQGEESLADSVLESYTWQLVNNMERAVKAAAALSEGLKEGVSHE